MIKWDDWSSLELRTLRRANAVLARQQRVAQVDGAEVRSEAYGPASIIGNQGINAGMNMQHTVGPLAAFHNLALNFFMLGMLYVYCERGDLTDTIHEITGGANHGDDEV
jgi:hypothetical protein